MLFIAVGFLNDWTGCPGGHIGADKSAIPNREVAESLSMQEGAVKVAAHRLRQEYREALRAEIAQTVTNGEELDDELRRLFETLSST